MRYLFDRITLLFVCVLLWGDLFANVLHVSKVGNDANIGSIDAPFLTISKAASIAVSGDTIMIHAGTYREYVNPPRGGTSESQRISYIAAAGEEVFVKGSEQISNWVNNGNGTWKITLPNGFFKGYNPYQLYVDGDYQTYGQWHHRGDVYYNNGALSEMQTLAQVKDEAYTWFTSSNSAETTIYANFADNDPNIELTEINVRELIFFSSRPDIDYITIDGIRFSHAALNWQAPNTGSSDPNRLTQKGAVGSNMGKYWIIQNCEVSHSKTAGIMMGESADNQHTFSDINAFGDHLIQNNIITRCGEYGIAGQKGLTRSIIRGNRIEDINYRNEFGGYEPAGIKSWSNVDLLIDHNLIQNCIGTMSSTSQAYCIWIDYANQGIQITRNVLVGSSKTTTPLFLEANMGANLVDNNFIIDPAGHSIMVYSGGSVFAHNLFINCGFDFAIQQFDNGGSGARRANSLQKHTLIMTNTNTPVEIVYNKMYNNIFAGGAGPFNFGSQSGVGNTVDHNLYIDGTNAGAGHTNSKVSKFDFTYSISQLTNGMDLSFQFDNSFQDILTSLVNPSLVGVIPLPNQSIEDKFANPIVVDADFNQLSRLSQNPITGPLESLVAGTNKISITTSIEPSVVTKYPVPISNPNYGKVNQSPFFGKALKIPGTIKPQWYDFGGIGVAFNDDDAKNGELDIRKGDEVDFLVTQDNDTVVSWFNPQDWMEYTVSVEPGMYDIRAHASSDEATVGELNISVNGKPVAQIDISNTGGLSRDSVFTVSNVSLSSSSSSVLKVSSTGGFNLGDIAFVKTNTSLPKAISSEAGFQVYPNPAHDIIRVVGTTDQIFQLKVYSLDGVELISKEASELDLRALIAGCYLITIDGRFSYTFVKE